MTQNVIPPSINCTQKESFGLKHSVSLPQFVCDKSLNCAFVLCFSLWILYFAIKDIKRIIFINKMSAIDKNSYVCVCFCAL